MLTSEGNNIFVQIASYRDKELSSTVESLYSNSSYPQNLRVCICLQHSKQEPFPKKLLKGRNIEFINTDYRKSKGANWARSKVQKNWKGEKYTLIIDSHIRFIKDWDTILIKMFNSLLSEGVEKPIVTGYPPSYDPNNHPAGSMKTPLKMYIEEYEKNLLTKLTSFPLPLWRWLEKPIPSDFISLGFLFTYGIFNKEIVIDPNIYFFGDEMTTTIRAFCHGYDFFHPHRIICWHLYERRLRKGHWDNHPDWREINEKSYRRIRKIFSGKEYKNYELGQVRKIRDYERRTGYKLILK